jgi:hypothetical protein
MKDENGGDSRKITEDHHQMLLNLEGLRDDRIMSLGGQS